MNQKLAQKQFIARAQMLARVMTGTSNIKVTVSGNGAYRQPGLINLPAGDFSDPEWLAMLHGWVDHELGHEDESDFNVTIKASKECRLLNDFRNIFEDIRMEESRGKKFKGARINLNKLTELAVKRNLFQEPSTDCHPIIAVQWLCLYYGRSLILNQTAVSNYADISKQLVAEKLGENLMNDICSVIHKIEFAKDNADSLLLAREVILLIKNELDKQNQEQDDDSDSNPQAGDDDDDSDSNPQAGDDDDDSDSNPQAGDEDDDSDSNPQAGDDDDDSNSSQQAGDDDDDSDSSQQAGDDDDDSDSSPQAGDDDDDSDSSQQAGDDDDDSNQLSDTGAADSKKPSAQEIIEALEQILNDDIDGLQDFHEALADLLSEDAREAKQKQPELASIPNQNVANTNSLNLSGELDELAAKRVSGGVYQTMHKTLFDQVQSLEAPRKTGSRILNSKISGIPAGNLNVFKRYVEQLDVKAAISVLVDASGSMQSLYENKSRMSIANSCAYAFALALDKCGVAVEVSYYGSNDGTNYLRQIAKPFEQKPKADNFRIRTSGYTPTGENMMQALSSLAIRPEAKKMLIVITDGEPDCESTVKYAAELSKSMDIKLIPIGIATKVVGGFDSSEFVTVNSPADLTSALRDAVKLKLFN